MQGNNGDTDIENRLMDKSRGEEGESEMNREGSMEAYTLTHVKQTANGNLLCDSGNSNWGSAITLRGRIGREGGSRGREHIYTYG